MPFILYYDKGLARQAQWYIVDGTPIDKVASTLGIIALSHRQFANVAMAPASPAPPSWLYDGAPSARPGGR